MKEVLKKLESLDKDVFNVVEYESKYSVFCRGRFVAELKKNGKGVLVPHFCTELWNNDLLYKLICWETVRAFRKLDLPFYDDPFYIGEVPQDYERQIGFLATLLVSDVCEIGSLSLKN